MSQAKTNAPDSATVRLVAWLATGWAVLGLGAQVIFTTVLAPALDDTFDFTIPGRGPTLAVSADTSVMSVSGLVVTAVGLLVAIGAVLLVSTNQQFAYAVAVMVVILVPGFVALVVCNGVAAISAGENSAGHGSLVASFASILAIALGAISIIVVSKRARPTQS